MFHLILAKLHDLEELIDQEPGPALIESVLITAFLSLALVSGFAILMLI